MPGRSSPRLDASGPCLAQEGVVRKTKAQILHRVLAGLAKTLPKAVLAHLPAIPLLCRQVPRVPHLAKHIETLSQKEPVSELLLKSKKYIIFIRNHDRIGVKWVLGSQIQLL